MEFSRKQVQKLGKRLRDGSRSSYDLAMLADYRASFDPVLMELGHSVANILNENSLRAVFAGRSKRTKSIIRKLSRPENQSMDLSRMADLVGLRVIIDSKELQNDVVRLMMEALPINDALIDYTSREHGYRAVHLIAEIEPGKPVEIQIRTCPQHLWAEESEAFGEIVKEGGGDKQYRDYLDDLAHAGKRLDEGFTPNEADYASPLMNARMPLSGRYPRMLYLYNGATVLSNNVADLNAYLVIYNNQTNELIRIDQFAWTERDEALKEYKRITAFLDEERFDVLFLNSGNKAALAITHSRYVPFYTFS